MVRDTKQNWRRRFPTDRLAMVELIGAKAILVGLKFRCGIDIRAYQKGIEVRRPEGGA